jgi:hypothetical protein
MTGKPIPLEFQAAVAKYEAARETLSAFRNEVKNARVLETHDHLRGEYNDALLKVKQAYKKHFDAIGKKYGDFSAVQKVDIDADKLLNLMGSVIDPILKIKYSVDRDNYYKAIAAGIIPSEIVEQVEAQKEPEIRGPKEA